ncbi:hypothetical protein AAFN60_21045 [Roseibacillus persicicus]|uniref:hypothetical protein n=1 Tax=Roseibacillus persicicus TaxID=454148 RepID=UPI00398A74FC
MKTKLPLFLLALSGLPLLAAPSVQLPKEWFAPLESQTGFALTDTATGQVRVMTFSNANALQQTGPTETYLANVTGLASGYFEGGPEHLILSSATHNQMRFLPVDGSASPSSRSTAFAGPQSTIPLFEAGLTPMTLSHCLYVDGGEGAELNKTLIAGGVPSSTDEYIYDSGATALQPFRVPGTGERRGMLIRQDTSRLQEIRNSGDGNIVRSTKFPVPSASLLATEVQGNDGRLCTVAWVPGDSKCGIFTHGFSGFPQGFTTTPSIGFPIGTIVSVGTTIPNAPDGILITSQDGTVAVWARIIAGTTLSIQETFFASAGTAFSGLVPVPGRGFMTLLGTPGDRTSSNWDLYRDSGAGFQKVASGNLTPWIDTTNHFATLFWFDDQALIQPMAQLLRVETVPDWTTGTGSLPQAITTELRDLNPNDGDGDQGLNNPSPASPVAPAGATFVMSNQYQDNASVSALDDSVTLTSLPLNVSPDSGTYAESVLVKVLADSSTLDIRYREDTPGSVWQTYEAPLTIGYPSDWLFYAYDRANRVNGPIISRSYQFSSPLNDLDSDQDGVPDYVERHFGLDPAGGADSDGDFQSDLEEILGHDGVGTGPNDSGDYLAEEDRDPPYLGEGFYLFAQAYNPAGTGANAFDDGGTPVTDPDDANLAATQREDDTPGEKIRSYNMLSELMAVGEVSTVADGTLVGQNAARIDVSNPLPESEWLILSSPIQFDLAPSGTVRGGRETLRVASRPVFAPPTIAATATGTDRSADALAWVAAARTAHDSFDPVTTITRLDPIDNAIAALAEQALYESFPPADLIALGVPSDIDDFTLFGGRDYDSGKTPFSEEMKRALVTNGCDFPAIIQYLDSQARLNGDISDLSDAIYSRHVAISDSTPNMALPLDALRSVLRDGAITDPGSVVALTYNGDGEVDTSTTRTNPYSTISASLISNARSAMLSLLANVPSLKRDVETWTITIESPTTPLHNYDYRRTDPGTGDLAYFVDSFGDRVLIEQGLGLNIGAVFQITGYVDVDPVGTFDTMEAISLELVFTPVATDTDSNGNLLDDDWEKFFFGDLGVVNPFDPHPITGHSYFQYHLEGADPRDGDLDSDVVNLAPSDITIVWLPVFNAYDIEFTFPDEFISAVDFDLLSSETITTFAGPVQEGGVSPIGEDRYALRVTSIDSHLDKNFFRIQMSLAD